MNKIADMPSGLLKIEIFILTSNVVKIVYHFDIDSGENMDQLIKEYSAVDDI